MEKKHNSFNIVGVCDSETDVIDVKLSVCHLYSFFCPLFIYFLPKQLLSLLTDTWKSF